MVGPVVEHLREPDAQSRVEFGPIVTAANDDRIRIRLRLQEFGPGWAVPFHLGPKLGQIHVVRIDSRIATTGRRGQVPRVRTDDVASGVKDRPVGARRRRLELLHPERGASVQQLQRRPDVVGERIVKQGLAHVSDHSSMRRNLNLSDIGDLLELPLVAVLAIHRSDGSILLTPVWHEFRDGGFNVWVSQDGQGKLRLIERDPRISLVVCESDEPYRGVELRGVAKVLRTGYRDVVRRTSYRYMSDRAQADAFADKMPQDGAVIRLEPGNLRIWDYAE